MHFDNPAVGSVYPSHWSWFLFALYFHKFLHYWFKLILQYLIVDLIYGCLHSDVNLCYWFHLLRC